MHVLLTGYMGYIGPVFLRLVQGSGFRITGMDTGFFRECLPAGQSLPPMDRTIQRDIRHVELEDLAGVDAVVHMAGLSNDPLGHLNPTLTQDINYNANVRLANLAKQAGVSRFVFMSSCSIYGAAGDNTIPLDETAPINPVSEYAVSKVRTEEYLSTLADDHFSPVYMRNATAFGVSPLIRFDLVLNNLMAWAMTTGRIKVLSDGTPWRPLAHIEDISLAVLCALKAPKQAIHNQAFNIVSRNANYQVREIAEAVQRHVAGSALDITGENGNDPRSYRVDSSKALNGLPGFEPKWDLETGCQELVEWFKSHPLESNSQAFDNRYFVRLKQVRHLLEQKMVDDQLYWVR
ncbi:MAG: SDR family oxidoreductase [Magnetococcales bacterium]|nr:SDR family oxidoreductase [Magnetococcales bacterium]